MRAFVRAAFAAALVLLLSAPTIAADKSFKRDDLADGAIKLEAQIKAEAGQVTKSAAALRREVDAAFQRGDNRGGVRILGQIVAVAPDDSANWLRLARTVLQTWPSNYREKTLLLERAATAAYIAYQRSGNSTEEAESLVVIAGAYADRAMWRPALDTLRISLELREVAEVRQQYERMREDHGFRLLDYTVDSDAASPRVCFQFSEDLPSKRADFSPFVAVGGQDKPALSVQERQLCVEGLKHGERYAITLRAGIPSQVKETLSQSADFNIYVRDRKPLVRFTGKAYVLPRTGQRGIPVVSVNTGTVALEIYRIGDRNLLDTVVGDDFQRNLDRYDLNRLTEARGSQVWKGEMAIEQTLNTDVTTAFPVAEAVGALSPGVYVMVAQVAGAPQDEFDTLATQWFIVSDLGLTAFSGNDGIHAFVHSLDTTQPKSATEVRLLSRSNEVLARKPTDDSGHVQFEANLVRGEGALAPAMLIASDSGGDYAFLSLKAPAFDLTDRGVSGRVVPAGLDAFVYTERGVYRSGETVQVTTLLRDGQGMAALDVPLTLVVERPDGVEYRRAVVPDQGLGGRALSVALVSSAPTGTWRVRAFADPKRPPVGEATFLVEDYVPDRIEFDLASKAKGVSNTSAAEIAVEGRFLYGAPAAKLELEGE
jgi:alpha-2-macroglobulin